MNADNISLLKTFTQQNIYVTQPVFELKECVNERKYHRRSKKQYNADVFKENCKK